MMKQSRNLFKKELNAKLPNLHSMSVTDTWNLPGKTRKIAKTLFLFRGWVNDESNFDRISLTSSSGVPPPSSKPSDLHLVNLLHAKKGSALFRLGTILTRIEDMSHILVWTTSDPNQMSKSLLKISESYEKIALIELPRLKMKFQPRKDDDGAVRMYLLDHSGWFISDNVSRFESVEAAPQNTDLGEEETKTKLAKPPGTQFLAELLDRVEDCLILENHARELQILVPNHDLYRPTVFGEPFSTRLVCDRSCQGWQSVMESRYYLYPVHTSKTFLLTTTLESTLYLALLRFLHRKYSMAFKLIDTCCVDTNFTDQEKWIFEQFHRGRTDCHPDAHACRLKLTLSVMHSKNKFKWEVHEEMERYLMKTGHVSADCTLTSDEELDVLYHTGCKGTPLIKDRLDFLKGVSEGNDTVTLKGRPCRVPGQPWLKLTSMSREYLEKYGRNVARVHYKRPEGGLLLNDKVLELIWESLVISDEESGANRQLGFLFLYELLTGVVQMNLLGENCTRSLGELLTRHLHLRLARWGQEATDEGEEELASSWPMAQLANVILLPQHSWPVIPQDANTGRALARGININARETKESLVKWFVDQFKAELTQVMRTPAYAERALKFQSYLATTRKEAENLGREISVATEVARWKAKHRLLPPDTACGSRPLTATKIFTGEADKAIVVTDQEVVAFSSRPLSVINLDKYVVQMESPPALLQDLPFDVRGHPMAQTIVARDMIKRIREDVGAYAKQQTRSKEARIVQLLDNDITKYLTDSSSRAALSGVVDRVSLLIDDLTKLQQADAEFVERAVTMLQHYANVVKFTQESSNADIDKHLFLLKRFGDQTCTLDINFLASVLISNNAKEYLLEFNPFLENTDEILTGLGCVMFRTNRISHANRAITLAVSLRNLLRQMISSLQATPVLTTASQISTTSSSASADSSEDRTSHDHLLDLTQRVRHTSINLASLLVSKRHYVAPSTAEGSTAIQYNYDPRFLIFEYIRDLLLRGRQVEMVNDFVNSMKSKEPARVQQMIMGGMLRLLYGK